MFKDMKIGTRLGVGFGVVILAIVAIAGLAVVELKDMMDNNVMITTRIWPKTVAANNIINEVNIVRRASYASLIADGREEVLKETERMSKAQETAGKEIEKLDQLISDPKEKELLTQVRDLRAKYKTAADKYVEMKSANQSMEECKGFLLATVRPLANPYTDKVDEFIKFENSLMETANKASAETYHSARGVLFGLSAAALLLAVGIAFWITRSITKPLALCMDSANRIARGDMDVALDATNKDETGQLMLAMQEMIAKIQLMAADANMLAKAAVEGKLATRVDAAKHQGAFQNIVKGMNKTIEALGD